MSDLLARVLLAGFAGVVGLVVGSFLNVVVWRVPRGESVIRPASRCPRCGHHVRWWDNVPVLSWLMLGGRCRDCDVPISVRYPLVELVTGALFAVMAWRLGPSASLPAYLYLTAIGVALSLIDLDVHRLPDAIVLPSYLVLAAMLTAAAASTGEWPSLIRAACGMAILYGVYLSLALIHPAGMGFGDVKLAGVLGLALGWLGWGPLAVGAFLGFLLGGVVGGGLMLAGRATRKSGIPFGPFMLAGAGVAVLFGSALTQAYVNLLVA